MGEEGPAAGGWLKFKSIMVSPVAHVEDFEHFLTFFHEATQPAVLEKQFFIAVLDPGREAASLGKVVARYIDRLVDSACHIRLL